MRRLPTIIPRARLLRHRRPVVGPGSTGMAVGRSGSVRSTSRVK
jgi:hypothetical protein